MNKYLIEILKIKSSVILPGFGTLMITNKRTGKIVINQLLKFDDGVLAEYISQQEGVEKNVAKNMISKFIREIESVLGDGDTYDIFQFGKISKNEKDELHFEMDPSLLKEQKLPIANSTEKDVKSKVRSSKDDNPINTFVPPTKGAKKEDKPLDKEIIKPDAVKDQKVKIIKETDKITEKKAENTYVPIVTISEATKKDKSIIAKELEVEKEKKEKELELVKKKAAKELTAKKKEEAKLATIQAKKEKSEVKKNKAGLDENDKSTKKKNNKLIPIIILLLIIGGGGFTGYKFQDNIKGILGMSAIASNVNDSVEHTDHDETILIDELNEMDEQDENVVIDEIDEATEDFNSEELEQESVVIEELEVLEEVKTIVKASVTGNYHIIGGSFSEKSNATGYAEKNNGTVLGEFGNLYLVALKSYDSRAEAKADLDNVQSISSNAYIFKYTK
jgi:nucleoid DNA-binding protein